MTITIACTWKPHGDEERLRALAGLLAAHNVQLCVALIDGDDAHIQLLGELTFATLVVRPALAT